MTKTDRRRGRRRRPSARVEDARKIGDLRAQYGEIAMLDTTRIHVEAAVNRMVAAIEVDVWSQNV